MFRVGNLHVRLIFYVDSHCFVKPPDANAPACNQYWLQTALTLRSLEAFDSRYILLALQNNEP